MVPVVRQLAGRQATLDLPIYGGCGWLFLVSTIIVDICRELNFLTYAVLMCTYYHKYIL